MKNYWKNMKKHYGSCFLQECSYHSVHHDSAKYFHTSNQLMFQFLWGCENSRVRQYSRKKKSIESKMITKIINDSVISSSVFKIVKIYHNYISHQHSHFNVQLGWLQMTAVSHNGEPQCG